MITLESVSAELADAVEAHLPGWVRRSVERICAAAEMSAPDLDQRIDAASQESIAHVMPRLRRLFDTDIDEQRSNPLDIVRGAVRFPTSVLRDLGVPEVLRDDFAAANFPDDVYDLSPAAFSDIAPELADLGIAWGAAKAHTHLERRRAEGLR